MGCAPGITSGPRVPVAAHSQTGPQSHTVVALCTVTQPDAVCEKTPRRDPEARLALDRGPPRSTAQVGRRRGLRCTLRCTHAFGPNHAHAASCTTAQLLNARASRPRRGLATEERQRMRAGERRAPSAPETAIAAPESTGPQASTCDFALHKDTFVHMLCSDFCPKSPLHILGLRVPLSKSARGTALDTLSSGARGIRCASTTLDTSAPGSTAAALVAARGQTCEQRAKRSRRARRFNARRWSAPGAEHGSSKRLRAGCARARSAGVTSWRTAHLVAVVRSRSAG